MINSIKVFDNIIPLESQDKILNYVLNKKDNWKYYDNINYVKNLKFNYPANSLHGDFIDDDIKNIINNIEDSVVFKLGSKKLMNYRYKINWQTPYETHHDEDYFLNGLHIDKVISHIAMVYYINDTDGDTMIYEDTEMTNSALISKKIEENNFSTFKLQQRVSPKKGRLVVFDGKFPHYALYPTVADRYIINFNLVIDSNSNKTLI